jgi:hypothetical protein
MFEFNFIWVNLYLVLNEINQHANRLDDKPTQFKLADICHPVCIKENSVK